MYSQTHSVSQNWKSYLRAKASDYSQLVKLRLNLTVVFSAAFGFLMASEAYIDWMGLLILSIAGFLVTSSANAINQLLEKDYDRLMKRTENRPLPTGRMEVSEAVLIAGVTGVVGMLMLWFFFNSMTALLGALSLISYAFIYTPMKRYSPVSVFVGAIPGALPVMIGWVAITGSEGIGIPLFSLFAIQFLWQFPHFWAIGWIGYDSYKRAGFKMLPTEEDGRNTFTAFNIILYIVALIFVSVLPYIFGMVGNVALITVLMLGFYFLYTGIQLYKNCDDASALKVMYGSLLFLPISQIVMVLNMI